MSKKEKENIQQDDFNVSVRKKLGDHRMPVDIACWEQIEQQLSIKTKKSEWGIYAIVSTAVAAALIFVILLNKDVANENKSLLSNDLTINVDDTVKLDQNALIIPTKSSFEVNLNKEQEMVKNYKSLQKQTVTKKTLSVVEETKMIVQNQEYTYDANDKQTIETASTENDNEGITDVTDPNSQTIVLEKEPIKLIPTARKKQRWHLAALVGSGNNSSMDNTSFSNNTNGRMSILKNDFSEMSNSFIPYEDFTEKEHSMPISFGIVTRKNLDKYTAIETGLVYTYMSSKLSLNNSMTYKAEQRLYYLGIPLNLIIYMKNTSKWNAYASVGGMLEKGLRASYTQDIYDNERKLTRTTSTETDIHGMQLSLNSAIGITYKVYKDWGIYVEPKVSYYFDNDQPSSIRTDKDFLFGVNAGLRYEF